MEGLVSRITAWETERGIEFTYDGVRSSHYNVFFPCFRLLEMTELLHHLSQSYLLLYLACWPSVDAERIYQFDTGKRARTQKTRGKFSIPSPHSMTGPHNIFVFELFRTSRDYKVSL